MCACMFVYARVCLRACARVCLRVCACVKETKERRTGIHEGKTVHNERNEESGRVRGK